MTQTRPTKSRRKGWTDLVVKVLGVVTVGIIVGRYVLPHYLGPKIPTDHERWLARPKLSAKPADSPTSDEIHSSAPCLFLVPPGVVDQPVVSGSVGECLSLVPNGKRLNLLEIKLALGEVLPVKTDLYVPGSTPLAFTRTYFPPDGLSQRFHLNLPHVYDPYLSGSRLPYTYSDWLLPDRQLIHFERISPGTGFSDYIGESRSQSHFFANARIAWNGWGWDVALPDGGMFLSPEAYAATRPQQGSLTGIFDESGREVKLDRADNGDLKEITSPSGEWIRLVYNKSGQVTRATTKNGDYAEYGYDEFERLRTVSYSDGRLTKYAYSPTNAMVSVFESTDGEIASIAYDDQDMPSRVTFHGQTTQFRFATEVVDKVQRRAVIRVDLLQTPGRVKRVRMELFADRSVFWKMETIDLPAR